MSMIPCFLYARKSTEAEDRQVLSIEAQVNEMKEIAARLNLQIVEVLTESKSAKEPGRPVFNAMMKRLYRGEASGVLCWKLDRLARNPIDGASIIWAMKQHSISIFTPAQTYCHEDENTILLYIEFGMAQKYIDDLSKNVKRGIRMKLEKGGWPSPAPPGYLNDKINKTIIKDTERFRLIRKMWDLMLTGSYSVEGILRIANHDWGFRSRRCKRLGGKPLSKSGLYRIFTNPFYSGYLKHSQGIFKGNHEAMITPEEFDQVQEMLGRNTRPRSNIHYFPFAGGLIKCGECGCSVTAEHKVNRHGSHYIYYHCGKKKKKIQCTQPSIQAQQLEEQILSFLSQLQTPVSLSDWILKYVILMDAENNLMTENKIESLKGTLQKNQRHVEELNRMRYRNFLNDDEFLKEKTGLLQEQHNLERKLEDIAANGDRLLPVLKKTIHFAAHAPEWFKVAKPEQKRLILETVGSNPVLKDKTLLIQAQIPFTLHQSAVFPPEAQKARFEPSNFDLDKQKVASSATICTTWRAKMNDIRTFLEGNIAWQDKFESVYKLFVEM